MAVWRVSSNVMVILDGCDEEDPEESCEKENEAQDDAQRTTDHAPGRRGRNDRHGRSEARAAVRAK